MRTHNKLGTQRRQGRPAAIDVEALNQLILQTAKSTFINDGYEGASVERISALAGIGKVTIYRRYESKEALFLAVLEDMTAGMWRGPESLSANTDPLELLRARCEVLLEMTSTADGLAIYRVLIDASRHFPDLVLSTVQRMRLPVEGKNLELLKLAQQQGSVRSDIDVASLARVLSSMITGWPLLNGLVGDAGLRDSTERAAYFETAWSLFLRGIRP
ncbi:TetR/AcrR family transcriptional regulator [Asticcacaulis excentricus]|uniref:Regulatory protein TetR n=1 Tax=Asticcacaulis excentricus (strain ATCC 15261 / DSM 4724 / KCTC 12464 / NCIMB 9791 / VKM B-1370 / CB 48) TaxID=573065 RepID=E8RN98_ASTEC|nr:TetR/AcrR family transcriptional regulator [Asticcacaulis excentricus]ADU13997.1 regulatory protein TetR [Asticcacaulis excentricus CB 48]